VKVHLVGACGLERLVAPLRARGWDAVLAPLDAAAAEPGGAVVWDPFPAARVVPVVPLLLRGDGEALAAHAAAVEAAVRAEARVLAGRRVLVRGLRAPLPGLFGVWATPPALAAWPAIAARWAAAAGPFPVLELGALWARHGRVPDAVPFGFGHGEAAVAPDGDAADDEAAAIDAWLHALRGPPVKLVAVDLDDTLIHGELAAPDFASRNPAYDLAAAGDDLGAEAAWWRLRRGLHEAVRVAAARGLWLALVTRNPMPLVEASFRRGPWGGGPFGQALGALALDVSDFTWVEAGFGPKSAAVRRVAAAAGIALDSVFFLDDHPVERAEVRAHAPGVRVWDGAVEAARAALLWGAGFDGAPAGPGVDRGPAVALRAAADGAAAAGPAALADFRAGLGVVAAVRALAPEDAPRVDDLLRRARQLRLSGVAPAPGALAGSVAAVRDRFGDHGLVAAFLVDRETGDFVEFACSCRVLPLGVAGALLGALAARHPGAAPRFRDTGHNAAAAGLVAEAAGPAPAWLRVEG